MSQFDHLPSELNPYTGSFELDANSKSDILACLPDDSDDISALRSKMQKLVTYFYITYDDVHKDPPTLPSE